VTAAGGAPPAAAPLAIVPAPTQDPFAGQLIVQVYRGAYSGRDPRAQLARDLVHLQQLGLRSVCFHGFPRELAGAWDGLAKLARDSGLVAIASWGLDGTRDNDGTTLTSREKGLLIGEVLRHPLAAAGLLDAEGRWDHGGTDPEGPTEVGALELGAAIRERAPLALVGDQPWPWIESHGDLRTSARPLREGGVFRGFPVDEFATVANWGRFRQDYWIDWAQDAYLRVTARMEQDWGPLQSALRPLGLDRPLRYTVQGYKHREKPHHLAHCLLERMVQRQEPVVMWSDPMPDRVTLPILQAVLFLVREGYAAPGVDPREAVRRFQRAHNARAAAGAQLDPDGWMGWQSIEAAGFRPAA
jgi:hypothetical protein